MAKQKRSIEEDLILLRSEVLLHQKIDCSKEDNKRYNQMKKDGQPLPEGVYEYHTDGGTEAGEFYTVYIPEITKEDRLEYILLKQHQQLKTMKNCLVFFATLTIISIVLAFIFGISA